MTEVFVLRLSHRKDRDKRVTTHCALVARAFLAKKIYYTGDKDEKFEKKVMDVARRWGGPFEIEYVKDWKKLIKNFDGIKVHLTMYGTPLNKKIDEIKQANKILVIIGSEKVPGIAYELADYNISITTQPHSEIAALAIFLDRVFEGKEFDHEFSNAKVKIIPQEKGKKVISLSQQPRKKSTQ
ncbi:MAG: tRNA (cytidine(56)-2'-O)-methyltransferase [Candidatus Aenigmarchaeota archaeon]|nr:tRNA (cytidine(56)-2'-O)-methyltransferase [Candidatus Aenigmarchaeota archaeon]